MRRRTKSSYRMLNETCAIGRAVWKSAVLTLMGLQALGTEAFRPPAVPLVAWDPYFSIWSPADKLTDADTVHWTGKPHRLTMLARIDNKPFRVMGTQPTTIPPLPQVALEVLPTRTIYTFEAGGLRLMVTFMTPMLPDDMELLSRPVTYVTCQVQAIDGKRHSFQNYFDASPEIAVNHPGEDIEYKTESVAGLSVLGVGSVEQSVLGKKGDDIR